MNTKIIEKNHAGFDGLSFILKARGNDKTRPAMFQVHITKNQAVCTDGRRLHIFNDNIGLSPGNYDVLTANKKNITLSPSPDQFYPDYQKVIDDTEEPEITTDLNLTSASLKKNQLKDLSTKYFYFIKDTGILINLAYLSDLSGYLWKVSVKNKRKVVVFKNTTFTALIMPIVKV